jgi:hypothetical protein
MMMMTMKKTMTKMVTIGAGWRLRGSQGHIGSRPSPYSEAGQRLEGDKTSIGSPSKVEEENLEAWPKGSSVPKAMKRGSSM